MCTFFNVCAYVNLFVHKRVFLCVCSCSYMDMYACFNACTVMYRVPACVCVRVFNMFGLIFLFSGISTFFGYLMPKRSFLKNSNDTI